MQLCILCWKIKVLTPPPPTPISQDHTLEGQEITSLGGVTVDTLAGKGKGEGYVSGVGVGWEMQFADLFQVVVDIEEVLSICVKHWQHWRLAQPDLQLLNKDKSKT